MSTTIDTKVVEMRFDNKHFENNVSTTMSTLDKLQQKLHLDGATKGLENVDAAAKKVNMSSLSNAVETVQAKFSALQVIGVTALANLTNSAVNAGKNIINSLTIAPITTGFSEYELKMGSIQTIMAGTGESLDTVNKYLNELNKYSDDTIYSFKDMTSNIGKFTNAGVKLEDAVLAIKGISNEAALSGANANEASRAMYNFSQALSSGFVKLIDWKSIELANMATKEFKEQLIETAVEVGTLKKGADGMYDVVNVVSKANAVTLNATKNFNDSLGNQWMTTEVLIETLRQYADETTEIGARASAAATEVKTFSMMMDTLREAAQSGWAQTWELLVGDYEEAKAFFTELSGIFGDILGNSADRRNNLLGGALKSNWDKFVEKLAEAGVGLDKFEEQVKEAVGAEKFDELIKTFGSLDKAIKDGAISSDILKTALDALVGTKAGSAVASFVDGLKEIKRLLKYDSVGEDVKKLQTALDALGYDLGAPGIDGIIGPITEAAIKAFQKDAGLAVDGIAGPETIAALEKAGNKLSAITGDIDELKASCAELLEVITKKGGRELLLDSLLNIINAIRKPLEAVGKAFGSIFTIKPTHLYNIIEGFNEFTKLLIINDETAEKLQRTFAGLFSLLKIITTITGGAFKIAFKTLTTILEKFDIGILDFTANIGDALVSFSNFINGVIDSGIGAVVDFVLPKITEAIEATKAWIASLKDTKAGTTAIKLFESLSNVLSEISKLFSDGLKAIGEWFEKLGETQIVKDAIQWFKDLDQSVSDAMSNISGKISEFNASTIVQRLKSFKDALSDIASNIGQSKVFQTMVNGICATFEKIKSFFGKFKLPEFNIDNVKKWFSDLVKIDEKTDASGAKGLLGTITGFGNHLKDNVISWDWMVFKENALQSFVTWWLKVGDKVKLAFEKLKEVVKTIKVFLFGTEDVTLPVIMDAVTKFLWIVTLLKAIQLMDTLVSPLDNITKGLENLGASLKWDAMASAFKSMALALGVFTVCIVVLTQMDLKKAWSAAGILMALMVVMGGIVIAMGLIAARSKSGVNTAGAVLSLLMLVASIAILIGALKEIDKLDLKDPSKTFLTLGGILIALSVGVRMISKAGGASFRSVASILTLMAALQLMLDVIESYDKFDWTGKSRAIDKMIQMMLVLAVAIRIMAGGVKAGASASGVAMALIAMVISLKVILSAIKDIAEIPVDDLKKGIFVISVIVGLLTAMMAIANLTSKGTVLEKGQKSVNNFTGLAVALLATVAAIWLLGKMDLATLKQGGFAVGQILILFTGMLAAIGATCSNLKIGSIIAVLITIGVIMAETAIIIKLLDSVSWESKVATAGALAGLLLAMAVVLRTLTKHNIKAKNIYKWIGALAVLSLVMAELALVLNLVKGVNPLTAMGNAIALGVLIGAMAGVLVVLTKHRNGAKSIYKWIGALAVLGLVVGELALILYLIRDLNPTTAIGNALAISVLLITMAGVLGIMSAVKVDAKAFTAIGAIAVLGLVVLELGGFLALIKKWDMSGMEDEVLVLSGLLGALTVVMAACTVLGTIAGVNIGGIAVCVGAIAVLGAVVLELGFFLSLMTGWNIGGMMPTVIVLSTLLIVLTGVMAACVALGAIASVAFGGMMGCVLAIAALGAVVLELGFFLSLMTGWDLGGMMPTVVVLSTLLIVLTGVMAACVALGTIASVAFGGMMGCVLAIAALGLVVLELGYFLSIMKDWGIGSMGPDVEVLSSLLVTLTGVMAACALIGIVAVPAIAGVGVLVLFIAALVGLVTAIGALMDDPKLQSFLDTGIEVLKTLAKGLGEVISEFGVGLTSGLPEIGTNLSTFAENLGLFLTTMDSVDKDLITKATTLADAIFKLTSGDFLKNVNNFFSGGNSLGTLGTQLSDFAGNAEAFINTMGGIKPETAATMESFITSVSLLNTICGDNNLTNGNLTAFGTNIKDFAICLKDVAGYFSTLTDEDAANIKRAADAAMALADLNAAIPKDGGLLQAIVGEQDLADWGYKISSFATSLINYSNKVSGKNIDVEAITKSAEAAMSLSDLNSSLPKTGGLVQAIIGTQDMATWGSKLSIFADGLVSYSNKMTKSNVDPDAIGKSAEAAKKLTDVTNALPKTGGVWQWIVGEQNIEAFGNGLASLGNGIIKYTEAISGIDQSTLDAIDNSKTAVTKIEEVVRSIGAKGFMQNVSAIAGTFTSDSEIQAFGKAIESVGDGLKTYCRAAEGITPETLTAITNSKTAVGEIEAIVRDMSAPDTTKIDALVACSLGLAGFCFDVTRLLAYDFSSMSLTPLKTYIGEFTNILPDTDFTALSTKFTNLNSTVATAQTIASVLGSFSTYDFMGVFSFKGALDELASANVDGVISAFSGKTESMLEAVNSLINTMTTGLERGTDNITAAADIVSGSVIKSLKDRTTEFKGVGTDYVAMLAKGLKQGTDDVSAAGIILGQYAATGAESLVNYLGMSAAGSYLGSGLVAGINAKGPAVYAAAYALGQLAVIGEKDGQASNSPSKETIKAGKWLGEGLIIGINNMGRSVYDAGSAMGEEAVSSISSNISKIAALVESGIDTQPTIRPVLDLSDVRAGASSIGGLFNDDASIGVLANVGSISSMMNRRSQNGSNADVVSALDKLSKKMDNINNPSYNINGISVNEGSDVADAIKVLVRAVTIDGRS